MIKFKIYSKFNNELKNILIDLYKNQNEKVFQNYNWLINENEIMNKNKIFSLKLIVIFEDQEPVAFLPMCIKRLNFAKILTWLSSEVTDYNCPVFKENSNLNYQIIDNVWSELMESIDYDVMFIDKIPEYINKKKNYFFSNMYKVYQKTYLLNFKNFNFEEFYINKNNNKSIQTDRRKFKILKNSGLKLVDQNLNYLQNHLNQKSQYYIKKGYKSFDPEALNKFYSKILKDKSFNYLFSKMECGDEIVSTIFGIIYKNTFYYLIPHVHDTKHKKYSPGKLHLIEIIKKYQNSDIVKIDFSPGDEVYKLKWSNQSYNIFYVLQIKSVRGLFFFIKKKIYFNLRKLKIHIF